MKTFKYYLSRLTIILIVNNKGLFNPFLCGILLLGDYYDNW